MPNPATMLCSTLEAQSKQLSDEFIWDDKLKKRLTEATIQLAYNLIGSKQVGLGVSMLESEKGPKVYKPSYEDDLDLDGEESVVRDEQTGDEPRITREQEGDPKYYKGTDKDGKPMYWIQDTEVQLVGAAMEAT
jgi:hypothetical protein